LYPKAQITPSVVQKMLVGVQKNAIHPSILNITSQTGDQFGARMLAEQRMQAQRKQL
jgi:hypothetical protein